MALSETVQQPIISPEEASAIAGEVQRLIRAGDERSAWERVRHLHPADMGAIVASLPRASRDTIKLLRSNATGSGWKRPPPATTWCGRPN